MTRTCEGELGPPAHSLDLELSSLRRRPVRAQFVIEKLHRQPSAREPRSNAQIVLPNPPGDIRGGACVELPVATFENVHEPGHDCAPKEYKKSREGTEHHAPLRREEPQFRDEVPKVRSTLPQEEG